MERKTKIRVVGGIVLAVVLAFRIRETRPPDSQSKAEGTLVLQSFKAFFACPSVLLLTLGCAGLQFVGMAFYTWMPTYMIDELGVDKAAAGFHAAFYFQLASIFGVMAGARISDKYVSRNFRMRALVQAAALILGAPFVFLMAKSSMLWVVNAAMFGFGFFKGAYDSNFYTTVYDVIEPKYRSAAASFILMFAFLVGAFAPKLLGQMSANGHTLAEGMQLMSYIFFFSAVPVICAIIFTMKRDIERITSAASIKSE